MGSILLHFGLFFVYIPFSFVLKPRLALGQVREGLLKELGLLAELSG
jgi:hypothetical protein